MDPEKIIEALIEKLGSKEDPKLVTELNDLKTKYSEVATKASTVEQELAKAREAAQKAAQAEEEANKLRAEMKKYEGIDPEAVRKVLDEQKAAEEKKLLEKGEFDRIKQMMADQHKSELQKVLDQLEEKDKSVGKLEQMINNLTVGSAFDGSKFVNEELVLTPSKARQIYASHFEVEDGRVVAYDAPRGSSNRTKLVDSRGNALGFEDALKKIVETDPDKEKIIRSKLKDGAGSNTTNARTTDNNNGNEPRGLERIRAILAERKKF